MKCLCNCGEETNTYRGVPYRFVFGHGTRGVHHPMYGKHHSPETKEYFRKLFKGKHFSPETEFKDGWAGKRK